MLKCSIQRCWFRLQRQQHLQHSLSFICKLVVPTSGIEGSCGSRGGWSGRGAGSIHGATPATAAVPTTVATCPTAAVGTSTPMTTTCHGVCRLVCARICPQHVAAVLQQLREGDAGNVLQHSCCPCTVSTRVSTPSSYYSQLAEA